MNAVLLFDEADALFSRRTEIKDAHDRYANADTNYLLQLLEEYEGVALLATNRKNNIDPAFIRRVRYLLEFPRPDAPARRRMWQRVVGELCGASATADLAGQLDLLADRLELSGAQIKNAVLASVFVARRAAAPLALDHLVRGIDRELAKEGRAMGRRELEDLYRDA